MRMPMSHDSAPALVLVNLGTPAAPTAAAVRRYLAQFLHDRRVVQLNRWLWCPLLHCVILPLRSPKVARKYAQIWMAGGSPLAVHTAALAEAVAVRLPERRPEPRSRQPWPELPSSQPDRRRAKYRRPERLRDPLQTPLPLP